MKNAPISTESAGFRPDMAAVRELVEPLVAAHGLALVDVEWVSGPVGKVLRVTIERPEAPAAPQAGVSLEHCVSVSRDVSSALDAGDLIAQAYNLEVSSPGLDRPLKSARDFARQVGRLAKVKLTQPAVDGQLALRGTIAAANDQGIVMEVDGKTHEVPLVNVREAKLVFELGAQPKKAAQPKKGPKRPKKGHT